MTSFEEAYNRSDAFDICRSFFANFESSAKNWTSLETLVNADDRTFWTVVARHEKLPTVVDQLVKAVDESHAAITQKHRVTKEHETLLLLFIVRLATKYTGTSTDGALAAVSQKSASARFARIIPASLLLPLSLMLLRRGGPLASVTIASFLCNCSLSLTQFTSVTSMWHDSVTQIATKCVVEAKRGRYQRRAGDILPLLERSYRLAKHVWALVNSAPYIVDYLDAKKVTYGLRILVEVIAPLLLHFIAASDVLLPRAPQLTRAVSMLVNAASSAMSSMVLIMTLKKVQAVPMPSAATTASSKRNQQRTESNVIVPAALRVFDQDCTEYMRSSCRGVPLQLLQRGTITSVIHNLQAPLVQEHPAPRLQELLDWVLESIPNSNDFSAAIVAGNDRLAAALIKELDNQGVTMEQLVQRGFLLKSEADRFTQTSPPPPAVQPPAAKQKADAPVQSATIETGDPAVDMVLGVLPHFSVTIVKLALEYFHNDVETLINEALSGNLPPHIQEMLSANETLQSPGVEDCEPPMPHSVTASIAIILDDELPEGNMEAYISQDVIGGDGDGDDDVQEVDTMQTLHAFSSTLSETLYVDDGFKENTFEFLYDDERDDAEDGDGGHVWGAADADLSDDDEPFRPLNEKGMLVPGSSKPKPAPAAPTTDDGHRHKPHGKAPGSHPKGGAKGPAGAARASNAPAGAAAPAYAKKSTVRATRKGAASGGAGSKAAVMRSVKKGNFE